MATSDSNFNAVATLLTSIDFLPGVKVLAHSIRRSRHPLQAALLLLIVPDLVHHSELYHLGYDKVVIVDPIPNPNDSHVLSWVQCGFTKLRIWQLHALGYNRVFYIDADCAVLDRDFNLDAQFDRLDYVDFAAAPDFFPPDNFNAGVLLIRSGDDTFVRLMRSASDVDSYDGGDTGYLNQMFSDWYLQGNPNARLPFGLNAQRAMCSFTRRAPSYWRSVPIYILHYSSNPKPWERASRHHESFDFDIHDDPNDIYSKLLSEADLQSYPASICQRLQTTVTERDHRHRVAALPAQFIRPPNVNFGLYGKHDALWLDKFVAVYNALSDGDSVSESRTIPLLIHQIWLGDQPIPPQFLQWAGSLRKQNPKMEYKLWRDRDVDDLSLFRRDLYDRATTPVQRSDILRLELLYQFGGVYADLDIEAVSPLENLLCPFCMVTGLGSTGRIEIMNSFLAATPRHPVVLNCLKELQVDKSLDIFNSTGPGVITRVLGNIPIEDLIQYRVGIMPAHVLYPLPNRMRHLTAPGDIDVFIDRNESFVVHHWSCSWQLNSPLNEAITDMKITQDHLQTRSPSQIAARLKQLVKEENDFNVIWSTVTQFI